MAKKPAPKLVRVENDATRPGGMWVFYRYPDGSLWKYALDPTIYASWNGDRGFEKNQGRGAAFCKTNMVEEVQVEPPMKKAHLDITVRMPLDVPLSPGWEPIVTASVGDSYETFVKHYRGDLWASITHWFPRYVGSKGGADAKAAVFHPESYDMNLTMGKRGAMLMGWNHYSSTMKGAMDAADEKAALMNVHLACKIASLEIRLAETGPRGGNIIGKTKSGKPIYDKADHPEHKGFTGQDHLDASDAHNSILKGLHAKASEDFRNGYGPETQDKKIRHHEGERDNHEASEFLMRNKRAETGPRCGKGYKIMLDSKDPTKTVGVKERRAETGPRGGVIIGKTESGKPIYDSHDHPAHKDFTEADHADAMKAHSNKMVEAKRGGMKRFMDLVKDSGAVGDALAKSNKDPEYQNLLKKEKHHSHQIDRHAGI